MISTDAVKGKDYNRRKLSTNNPNQHEKNIYNVISRSKKKKKMKPEHIK